MFSSSNGDLHVLVTEQMNINYKVLEMKLIFSAANTILFDCKPRFRVLFSSFCAVWSFLFVLSKGVDDAQPCLGYVLSTKLSFFVTEGIMMNRMQL